MANNTIELPEIDASTDPLGDLGLDFEAEVTSIHEASDNATFEDVETVRPTTEESIKRTSDGLKRIAEFLKHPKQGEPLYLDFETIPDFSRLHLFNLPPLPEMPAIDGPEALLPADQFLSQTVPEMEAWLAKHNPPQDWIDGVLAVERASKKPRKGFFDGMADHAKRIGSIVTAESGRIKTLSTNPLYCSVCCVSFGVGGDDPISLYAGDLGEEKFLIEQVWRMLERYTPVIGYGVSFFDIPVLLARSMILGVKPSRFLDRRKYGSRDIVDLCRELFNDDRQATLGLKNACAAIGIVAVAKDVNGSQVYDLWRSGKTDEICMYCESDVKLVQRLHREKMAGYFCV